MYNVAMIEKELVAASTEPLILSLLAKGESYGYELIQEIKRLSGEEIRWTDGMLYHKRGWYQQKSALCCRASHGLTTWRVLVSERIIVSGSNLAGLTRSARN
jgi:hypothetical protein